MQALLTVVVVIGCISLVQCEMKYNYFDDYLSSLDESQQNAITGVLPDRDIEGSGDNADVHDQKTIEEKKSLPIRTGLVKSKDVACCSLGQLAGDKGYHCFAEFYEARILLRNQNRAHNRKLGFYGSESQPNYGTKLMHTFEQCVSLKKRAFHKCCHLAALDRRTKPHFDYIQRKRYELKMKKIRMPKLMHVDNNFLGV